MLLLHACHDCTLQLSQFPIPFVLLHALHFLLLLILNPLFPKHGRINWHNRKWVQSTMTKLHCGWAGWFSQALPACYRLAQTQSLSLSQEACGASGMLQ